MNIFYLDPNPTKCARYHADKHCVKMVLEYAQLLSTAHRVLDGVEELVPYTSIKIEEFLNVEFLHNPEWQANPDYDREPEVELVVRAGKEKTRKDLTLYHQDTMMDCKLYRHTHQNHPSAIWVRAGMGNYFWLMGLFTALLTEYEYRYGREHKCKQLLPYLCRAPKNIKNTLERTEPTPAMPKEYIVEGDAVASYHAYYNGDKRGMFAWKHREVPPFIQYGPVSIAA